MPYSIMIDAGHGVVDSASNKNIKNTKRKATAVPIKTEYM